MVTRFQRLCSIVNGLSCCQQGYLHRFTQPGSHCRQRWPLSNDLADSHHSLSMSEQDENVTLKLKSIIVYGRAEEALPV